MCLHYVALCRALQYLSHQFFFVASESDLESRATHSPQHACPSGPESSCSFASEVRLNLHLAAAEGYSGLSNSFSAVANVGTGCRLATAGFSTQIPAYEKTSFGGLKDEDRIFTNLYCQGDPFIKVMTLLVPCKILSGNSTTTAVIVVQEPPIALACKIGSFRGRFVYRVPWPVEIGTGQRTLFSREQIGSSVK